MVEAPSTIDDASLLALPASAASARNRNTYARICVCIHTRRIFISVNSLKQTNNNQYQFEFLEKREQFAVKCGREARRMPQLIQRRQRQQPIPVVATRQSNRHDTYVYVCDTERNNQIQPRLVYVLDKLMLRCNDRAEAIGEPLRAENKTNRA